MCGKGACRSRIQDRASYVRERKASKEGWKKEYYKSKEPGRYRNDTGKGTLATRIYTKAQMALSRVMALGPWKLAAIGIGLVIST